MSLRCSLCCTMMAVAIGFTAGSTPGRAQEGLTKPLAADHPLALGVLVQGGNGVTDDRDGFKFLLTGVHAGKTLTREVGPGVLRGSFEYGIEFFPFWQSYTPKFQKASCFATAVPGTTQEPTGGGAYCSPYYTVGGTYSGLSLTPIILRWNLHGTHRLTPWAQGAGGVLWTNHKYPAYGSTHLSLAEDGPHADASVWNFTPQAGIGLHYFLAPRRSIDLGANAVHISSSSLGDRNPGVNASVQFNIGYSWWR